MNKNKNIKIVLLTVIAGLVSTTAMAGNEANSPENTVNVVGNQKVYNISGSAETKFKVVSAELGGRAQVNSIDNVGSGKNIVNVKGDQTVYGNAQVNSIMNRPR
jgi:hypothetical protein